jgi:transcriptional regulator with XRE-family HTH domain
MITKDTKKTLQYLEGLMGEKLTLGLLLLSIRQGEELSQVEFAKNLGLSRQALCDIERGRRVISIKKAIEYAEILGYPEKQFIRLCLQDMVDRENVGFVVELEKIA